MAIVLDGTAGITTPEITSAGGPLVVNASAPDNSVVVDAGGNVGIGTSSPTAKLQVSGDAVANTFKLIANTTVSGSDATIFRPADNTLAFSTNGSERARIDSSGNLLVGTTSGASGFKQSLYAPGFSANGLAIGTTDNASGFIFASFRDSTNTVIGSITRTGTTSVVAYNTSSDYRLKHDIQPMTGALAKVAQLKPCTYKWNADGSDGEGFIAHELAEVVPQCVTGEKDAVDADGNPQYQGIDTSFLVATLTAAIQEQQAIITAQQAALESLTARVVALEGQP